MVMFIVKGVITTFAFPAFSGHDEVMHYSYLKVLAEEGRVPVIPDLDEWRAQQRETGTFPLFDRAPEELYHYAHQNGCAIGCYTTDDWFGGATTPVYAIQLGTDENGLPIYYPSGWIYTANHPPIFYLYLTPVYWLIQGMTMDQQIYILRLATIPLGLLTVLFAYLTTKTIFSRDRFLAMMVPAFVALQPQIAYEATMVNNDIMAIMYTSMVVWLIAAGLKNRFPLWNVMLIGLAFGLAFLSKTTSAVVVVLIAFAMITGIGIRHWKEWLGKGALAGGIAGFIALPWLVFMISTYGDPTALSRVSELQYWNTSAGSSIMSMLNNPDFFWWRWQETWGAFGWRLILLDFPWGQYFSVLNWLFYATLLATLGVAVYALRFLREQRWMSALEAQLPDDPEIVRDVIAEADSTLTIRPWQISALAMMAFACVLGYYSVLQFGMSFALTQARYYFPMVVPAAIMFMLGLRSWFPRKWLPYVGAVAFVLLVIMNGMIYTNWVIPYWNLTTP